MVRTGIWVSEPVLFWTSNSAIGAWACFGLPDAPSSQTIQIRLQYVDSGIYKQQTLYSELLFVRIGT
jgi:hypothetical protein